MLASHKAALVLYIENNHAETDDYMRFCSLLGARIGDYVNLVVFQISSTDLFGTQDH